MPTSFGNGTSVTSKALNTTFGLKADLVSPALTGVPSAPTATAGTNTTQLATTAFVTTADNLKQNLPVGVAWTPTLASGTWTNITWTGRYVQANKLVQFWILGTATGVCALGTGFFIPVLNFPVAPQSSLAGGGHSVLITKTVTTYTGITDAGSASTIRPMVHLASGTYTITAQLADAVPVAWASGMTIWISGVYEAS